MNKADLKDLKEATREIYGTFFSQKVYFLPLLDTEATGIYHEKKKKARNYGTPVELVASVNFNPFPEESRADTGGTNLIKATFEVPTVILEEKGLMKIPLTELRRGILRFQGIDHNIVNIKPITNVDEIFLFHLFEVSGGADE